MSTELTRLPLDEVTQQLPPGWGIGTLGIEKTFIFADFREAFGFITRVALLAERMNHHPVIRCDYRVVELGLITHDAKGFTELDLQMAAAIQEFSPS
jgi:4a-hydroxytetrahydrobiopterin dehydratase